MGEDPGFLPWLTARRGQVGAGEKVWLFAGLLGV